MKKLMFGLSVPFLFLNVAYASCDGSETIFYCTTKKGKEIEVCDKKKTIEYSFGKKNKKPEIVLNLPRHMVTTSQWNGVGRYISYSVDIPNANTIYNVYYGMDRMDENHPQEAGVNVIIKGKNVATIECSSNIESGMEGVDLRPTE